MSSDPSPMSFVIDLFAKINRDQKDYSDRSDKISDSMLELQEAQANMVSTLETISGVVNSLSREIAGLREALADQNKRPLSRKRPAADKPPKQSAPKKAKPAPAQDSTLSPAASEKAARAKKAAPVVEAITKHFRTLATLVFADDRYNKDQFVRDLHARQDSSSMFAAFTNLRRQVLILLDINPTMCDTDQMWSKFKISFQQRIANYFKSLDKSLITEDSKTDFHNTLIRFLQNPPAHDDSRQADLAKRSPVAGKTLSRPPPAIYRELNLDDSQSERDPESEPQDDDEEQDDDLEDQDEIIAQSDVGFMTNQDES